MPQLTLPVGRLVYGHPSQEVHKKDTKKQPMYKDGKPVMVRMFGVAYEKSVFGQSIWPIMQQAAMAAYGGQQPPNHFAYKFKDGDGTDRQGKPYNTREGYAGCYVVHFETQFDLLAYRQNQNGGWDQITANDYKTGDYIAVATSIEGNKPADPTHTPGLYINPNGVLLIGHGSAIVNAPSADQMFGGQQFALPPGATAPGAVPTMPTGASPPGMPGAVPPAQPQQYQPAPQPGQIPNTGGYQVPPQTYPAGPAHFAAPVVPQQPPTPQYQPAHDFVQNATGQPPAQQYAPPAGQPMPGQAPMYGHPPQR